MGERAICCLEMGDAVVVGKPRCCDEEEPFRASGPADDMDRLIDLNKDPTDALGVFDTDPESRLTWSETRRSTTCIGATGDPRALENAFLLAEEMGRSIR